MSLCRENRPISIHSPHTRGDARRGKGGKPPRNISIHSPHTRGDCVGRSGAFLWPHFNPLPSYEGRQPAPWLRSRPPYFNPLPSYEGRRGERPVGAAGEGISIHSPHTRGDVRRFSLSPEHAISIHSPHTRGDLIKRPLTLRGIYFNPLPSYEGRPALPLLC